MVYMADYFIDLLASFLAVTIVLTLHEFAHAYVAVKCGDPTPKWNRRLSLNPLRHFDLVGLLCFTLVGFGWAKPVPINPYNFKKYKRGLFLTAAAGIVMNYLTAAIVFYPLYRVTSSYVPYVTFVTELLTTFTYYLYAYSLSFAVFNLLPLHPLDGFRIVDALNKRRGKVFRFLRENGHWILLGLVIESFLCQIFVTHAGIGIMRYFDILGWIMQFAVRILGWPIKTLWGLIPW